MGDTSEQVNMREKEERKKRKSSSKEAHTNKETEKTPEDNDDKHIPLSDVTSVQEMVVSTLKHCVLQQSF